MGYIYILERNGKYIHTYSQSLKNKYVILGYRYILSVSGWNPSIHYEKGCRYDLEDKQNENRKK